MRSKITIYSGGIGEAIAFLSENETPQLLIVETSERGDALFQTLEGLAEVCSPDSNVILIGTENDIALYRKLVSMGLSEYYAGTPSMEDLSEIIQGLYSETDASSLGSVISFIGSRGGVGSSSLAINTGYAIGHLFNENVTLVDLDLSFGTAALSANLQQKQSVVDALSQPNRLDDVLMARFLLKYDDNLSIVPAPSVLGANYGIQMEAFHVLLKILRQMSSYVLLDLPHQWLPWISEVLTESNEVVLTAYPDLASMRDVKNFIETLSPMRGVGSPPKLVFNRVGASPRSELSAKDFEEPLKMKFEASIPNDSNVFGTAMNNGVMIHQANPNSKVSGEINKLATLVTGRTESGKKKKSVLSMLLKGK